MKTAEEWAIELIRVSEDQGGIDSEQCLIPKVTEIQLDAHRAGMLEAANIVMQERFEAKCHGDLRSIVGLIEAAADAKAVNEC